MRGQFENNRMTCFTLDKEFPNKYPELTEIALKI